MASRIVWSPTARKSFDDLIIFLESRWDPEVIEKALLRSECYLKSNIPAS